MNLRLTIEGDDVLMVSLQDGEAQAALSVHPPAAAVRSLGRALQAALADGYGECFWPAATGGLYWWIFTRRDETLETVALWTRGGVAIWEHVFRATDAAAWVEERLGAEIANLGLPPDELGSG
jgi:hypothetical protein